MEMTSVLASMGERGKNFSFLRNLESAFLLLLALARSKKDVARLHSFLPENCQLLQNNLLPDNRKLAHGDLINLEGFWDEVVHAGNPPKGKGQRISDELARSFLERLCTYKRSENVGGGFNFFNLCDYYVEVLAGFATTGSTIRITQEFGDEDGESMDIWFEVWPSPISTNPNDRSHGENELIVSLFSQEFQLHCYLPDPGSDLLKIWLSVPTYKLTAGFLHCLATLPDFAVNGNVGYQLGLSGTAGNAGLCYLVPFTSELTVQLDVGQGGGYYVAREGFAAALKKKLLQLGIPLQGDPRLKSHVGV